MPRSLREWKGEIHTDTGIICQTISDVVSVVEDGTVENPDFRHSFGYALKEAQRLVSDIYRMAEVAEISREELDIARQEL